MSSFTAIVRPLFLRGGVILLLLLCGKASAQEGDSLRHQSEKHLRNIKQLTFGGENAEAYFSFDEKHLSFQSTRDSFACDQIFTMDVQGNATRLISTGKGKTTCAYYLPGDSLILYSSTHLTEPVCPAPPDYSKGYVWQVHSSFDIFLATTDGKTAGRLTATDGYDAEATISPLGDRIIFTSTRDGDLELYSMKLDGSDVKRLTHELGYDGGAFYSQDGKMIVYRTHHPVEPEAIADYKNLLDSGLVRPTKMEIFVMNADGTGKRQVTNANAASFAPFFHPNSKQIIFASNMNDPRGRNFDLFLVNIDGSGLEQVTFNETFDGFPMFTRDGKKIAFSSNRNAAQQGDTNVFIADWVP